MLVQTPAIVISSIAYGDTSKIIKLYTESKGIMSFIAKGVYSKKNKINALLSPLNLVNLIFEDKKSGRLLYFKEIQQWQHYQSLYLNPEKISIAFFLAEILNNVLNEEESNPHLFDFLIRSLLEFDKKKNSTADFHLWFLLRLTQFMGFYPYFDPKSAYFDLKEGVSTDSPPLEYGLTGEEILLWKKLSELNYFHQDEPQFHQKQRKLILHSLLKYYEFHISNFRIPNSVEVLSVIYEN